MRKVLSLLLVFALFFNFFVFAEEVVTEVKDNVFSDERDFIISLDIINSEIIYKETITRGEFTACVVNTFYPADVFQMTVSNGVNVFSDVTDKYMYYSEIKAAKDLGIVSGNGGNFNPEDTISYQDAVVILVNALGYNYYANANGGYTTGYFYAGKSIGLLNM